MNNFFGMKKKILILSILCLLVFSLCSLFAINNEVSADNTVTWYNYNDAVIKPAGNGDVSLANGSMYRKEKMSYESTSSYKKISFTISFTKTSVSTHNLAIVLSPTQFENYNSYKEKLGTANDLIGNVLVYSNETNYNSGTIQLSAFSGLGKWKNAKYPIIKPLDEYFNAWKHLIYTLETVQFLINYLLLGNS